MDGMDEVHSEQIQQAWSCGTLPLYRDTFWRGGLHGTLTTSFTYQMLKLQGPCSSFVVELLKELESVSDGEGNTYIKMISKVACRILYYIF